MTINFESRPNSSDQKTYDEVVTKKSYLRRDFQILPGERWLDLGANVGAFSLLATSLGATVLAVEPDYRNVRRIKRNFELNNWPEPEILTACVVHDETKFVTLNLWPEQQSWRNSIVRNRKGTVQETVKAVNFFNIVKGFDCIKMDIEGSEMPILEAWPMDLRPKKLVFEWTFDADPSIQRIKDVVLRLEKSFSHKKTLKTWPNREKWDFFPPCTTCWFWND